MRCFYHPEAEAVGLCKNCYKGVCRGCAEVTNGVACKSRCEAEVTALNRLLEQSKATLLKGGGLPRQLAVFLALVGIVMLMSTASSMLISGVSWSNGFGVVIGVALIIWAGLVYLQSRRKKSR